MACNKGQIKVVEALMAKNIPADPLDKYALCVTQTQTQTHGARIVCDAMRCARAGCIRAVRCDARDAQADALRRSMRCELFAMQCAARGLVAFARCRRHHAFDGGILRVGFLGSVQH